MKVFWALAIFVVASGACGVAEAAPAVSYDFEVVSVVPRSPSIQPFVMTIPAKERPEQAAPLKLVALDAKR